MKKSIMFLVTYIFCCLAQRGGLNTKRQCEPSFECILLASCPLLLKKAIRGNVSQRREVQNSVCKFVNRRMYVCCPNNTPTTNKPIVFTNGNKNLLPKNCGRPATDDRIFGGEIAPLGAYPWMVALGYKINRGRITSFECAGSLISSRYVLTAAHCVNPDDIPGLELSELSLGDWDLSNPTIDCEVTRLGPRCASSPRLLVGVEKVIIHENYNKRFATSDDIALLRMDRDLDLKKNRALVSPVCLPSENFDPSTISEERHPIAAGWGFTEHGNKSDILLRVEIPFAKHQKCKELYKERFTLTQVCAGGKAGFDSCGGDSGGPLILSGQNGPPFEQVGIVSFGPSRCATADFPAVYTSVAKYRKWIETNLKP